MCLAAIERTRQHHLTRVDVGINSDAAHTPYPVETGIALYSSEPGMNEDEWFNEIDYTRHVRFLESRLSERKRRLLAAAFCRAIVHLHDDSQLLKAVETAENFADGICTLQELEACRSTCREIAIRAYGEWEQWSESKPLEALKCWLLHSVAWATSYLATTPVSVEAVNQKVAGIVIQARTGDSGVIQLQLSATPPAHQSLTAHENQRFRELVWDLAGNLYNPVSFCAEWRTATTTALARGMYHARDYAAMPILADALQDAGCDHHEVLTHCRQSAQHTRGCWVLDQLLELY